MNILLKYRIGIQMLKLSLEILQTSSITATIGAAASIGQIEALILDFLAIDAPVTKSALFHSLI